MTKTLSALLTGTLLALATLNAQAETRALIETNMGKIELLLDEKKAPKTVKNFINYAEKGFYEGTIFHRVIDGFMIQGGGFTPDMAQKSTEKAISNEADNGLKNTVGTIAMARTIHPNSATSQFFINVADNDFLNFKNKSHQGYGYAVFGKVVGGMDVVKRIAKVKTTSQYIHQNVPVEPIVIKKVTVTQ
ncbi:peptidylprolyl isomerase [Neisseria weaveri]|uniref:Peptidyl-prolyl cis-trans isomerase n=1 Tax=Neisseria weaveri TaxID=28091 RepID=A0A448VQM2_9NEIS|nr:peptidylprolyl isomerase [Neisseria weaveri]EGV34728.1 peptidylprolyl isomerase A [Neisseria weaveri ATCC 51223]EGV35772.1 peptidylprolyl isomerase A [Neisseria weaveri LMG 5135]SAY50655.1 peptidyl-prolyl cis-trans isomerase A [Neisseria weaveri]VEJ52067.1 peptidyl-prolyl cis-trans isomerase A [Neisseria weaveri]